MSESTVIIPNWNGLHWLQGCLPALARQTCQPAQVIIVDNGSSDGSCDWLRQHYPAVQLIEQGYNAGFAAAVNAGILASQTPYVALLNNDTLPADTWLEKLQESLGPQEPQVAGICGKMLMMESPDAIENAGDTLSWQGSAQKRGHGEPAAHYAQAGDIFAVCAGGALYRRDFLERNGLFDERFFAYLEDIDLCLRGRLCGYRFVYEPEAILHHQGHGSALPSARYVRLTTANRLRLFVKNIPAASLWRHSLSILYGQWYFLICNRRPLASLAGYVDFLLSLPRLWRQRQQIRQRLRLSSAEINALLEPHMRQPSLRCLLRQKWQQRGGHHA